MPKEKDLKRLVRARTKKTGESYTAARSQILKKRQKKSAPDTLAKRSVDHASIAGMSDDAVRAKTDRTWAEWVELLDGLGASKMPHREIAAHLHKEMGLPGWWAQTVTVAYERIRGLRDVGQRRGGGYEVNKSKTLPVPIKRLFGAFATAGTRRKWLPDSDMKIRTSTRAKSMRVTWHDGTDVQIQFYSKGPAKSQVTIQHAKLASKAEADQLRSYWTGRLDELARLLVTKE